MGASTVTGAGQGSAMPNARGPGNNRNMYVAKNGPRVVAAGIATLPTVNVGPGHILIGDHTAELYVTFPEPLPEGPENYNVMLTPLGEHGGYGHADIRTEVYAKWGTTTFPVFHLNAYGGAAAGQSDVAGRMVQWTVVHLGIEV